MNSKLPSYMTCLYRITESARLSIIHHEVDVQDIDGPTATALSFINKKNARGLTPFQIALSLRNQHIKKALILIGAGADIDTK